MASNYEERLRQPSIDESDAAGNGVFTVADPAGLDARTLALREIAALVAARAAAPPFSEHLDAAVRAGASMDESGDVLVGFSSVAGVPRGVAGAPMLAWLSGSSSKSG